MPLPHQVAARCARACRVLGRRSPREVLEVREVREVLEVWMPEIDGIARLGGHIMLTMHPMLTGRPSRLAMLEQVIEHLQAQGAWIATAREVADHARAHGPLQLRPWSGELA